MQATHTQFDIPAIQASWQAFDAMTHLRHIRSKAEYDRLVALMNLLLDAAGDDEDHPLSGLLELVGDLVSKYEQTHYAHRVPGATCRLFWWGNERSARRWRVGSSKAKT